VLTRQHESDILLVTVVSLKLHYPALQNLTDASSVSQPRCRHPKRHPRPTSSSATWWQPLACAESIALFGHMATGPTPLSINSHLDPPSSPFSSRARPPRGVTRIPKPWQSQAVLVELQWHFCGIAAEMKWRKDGRDPSSVQPAPCTRRREGSIEPRLLPPAPNVSPSSSCHEDDHTQRCPPSINLA
jgi:hypothetical protein